MNLSDTILQLTFNTNKHRINFVNTTQFTFVEVFWVLTRTFLLTQRLVIQMVVAKVMNLVKPPG